MALTSLADMLRWYYLRLRTPEHSAIGAMVLAMTLPGARKKWHVAYVAGTTSQRVTSAGSVA